uniref:Refilin B n=1 Tax=Felis catus TaxID=9685 RepID=A0ABI8AN50_FELCA
EAVAPTGEPPAPRTARGQPAELVQVLQGSGSRPLQNFPVWCGHSLFSRAARPGGGVSPPPNLLRILGNPASVPSPLAFACSPRLCPLSFGEGVEFDPLPPTEVRYTSSVKYDSERHFIDDVHLPLGLAVTSCSQTVTCIPNCTWRNYKAEVRFEPRHKPTRFLSTTIVYPKYPKTVYTTTLDYNCRKTLRRFLSSVELEATELLGSDCLSDEC